MKKLFLFIFLGFFSLKGSGQEINTTLTYLVKEPTKKSRKTPVIVMLHGYSSNEHDLFDLAHGLDSRFIIFSLRAPTPVNREGFAWYKMDFLQDQKFKYDYQQAKESRQKILSFISNACTAYSVDSTRVIIMGFSQGAIMAYDLALAAPKKIHGIIALSGRMLGETKALKTDWPNASKVKFFIGHGNVDNVIKSSDAAKVNEFLKKKNVVDVTYKQYVMAHAISLEELNDIKSWLAKTIEH